MKNEQVQAYIDDSLDLLPSDKVLSQAEAQKRASKFLAVIAVLATYKHEMADEKIKLQSLFSIANNAALSSAEGTTVGARTASAEASEPYIEAREAVESIENNIRYIQTMESIFLNAHLMLRNMAKENF